MELEIPWKTLRTRVFAPALFLAFRLLTLTLGRLPSVSRSVKRLLVDTLIRRKSRPAVTHTRRIAIVEDGIEIADDIELPRGVTELRAIEHFTAVHMGSALYADIRCTGPSAGVQRWEVAAPARLRLRGRLTSAGAAWSAEA